MIIYISSYPRSGNSLMQDLITNFFERPITGMELTSQLIKPSVTKNWRYQNSDLPEDQLTLQLLASNLTKSFFSKSAIKKWLISYDLDTSPYTKNCFCLLPGCQSVLTPKNRKKLSGDNNCFFIKTHGFPYNNYFDDEYVMQIVRQPKLVFDSYANFLKKENTNYQKNLNKVIRGKVYCGSWSQWHQKWNESIPSLNGKFLRIRFEDVLSNPYQSCERIKTLIDLDYDSTKQLTSFQRLHQQNPEYYRSGEQQARNGIFTSEQIELINKLHGSMMKQLDYE